MTLMTPTLILCIVVGWTCAVLLLVLPIMEQRRLMRMIVAKDPHAARAVALHWLTWGQPDMKRRQILNWVVAGICVLLVPVGERQIAQIVLYIMFAIVGALELVLNYWRSVPRTWSLLLEQAA
jgi:hypothetical protein